MSDATPVHIGAVDLGASSGRVMVGTIADGRLSLTEIRRFSNSVVPVPTSDGERLFWDVLHLWNEVRQGLLTAVRSVGPLSAIGIDTWAVDYGLVNSSGAVSTQVHAYRSARTQGVPEQVFARIPAQEVYAINGLQVQDFNTLFQLMAQERDDGLPREPDGTNTHTLLLLPDLLACFLTGKRIAEVTNASTTGLVDACRRTWSLPLLKRLRTEIGLDLDDLLPDIIEPGTVIGTVRPEAADIVGPDGRPTPVIAVGSHDTASAVVSVPATDSDFAYVSCGTWSLVGLELDEPVLTEASRAANFTNELGVDHTVRYLKNIMGLWVLNEAVRTWHDQGMEIALPEADAAAADAEPLRTVVDINDASFYSPGDMAARIDEAAHATGQPCPRDIGEYIRCINDSLALAYRRAVRQAVELSGREVKVLHIVGGGIRNRLLCQLAADATGLPVLAGPAEGTALGNVVIAARGAGVIDGDLSDLRRLIRSSSRLTRYTPDLDTSSNWDDVERRLFG